MRKIACWYFFSENETIWFTGHCDVEMSGCVSLYVILSAHGNTIRALGKKIFNISDKSINLLEIPTGNPLVVHFDNLGKVLSTKYLDESRKKDILTNT